MAATVGAKTASAQLATGLSLTLWFVFLFGSVSCLVVGLVSQSDKRYPYLGGSVFAIAAIVLFGQTHEITSDTPGSMIVKSFLYTERNQPPRADPFSGAGNPDNETWVAQRDGISLLADVTVASVLALFGGYLGAIASRANLPKADSKN